MLQDLHRQLIEGRTDVPRVGSVVKLKSIPLYAVLDGGGSVVAPVVPYLRGLALDDNRPLTIRSYAYDLQRWFRLLWFLGIPWDRATEAEASALVGWLRVAPNPQRRRRNPDAPRPGSVNLRTGKPYLGAGYAPRTINHCLPWSAASTPTTATTAGARWSIRSLRRLLSAGLSRTGRRTAGWRSFGGPGCDSVSGRPTRGRFPTRCGTSCSRP